MSRQFTVIGYWDDNDRRHVIGVIEGEHDVMSGVSPTEGGLFAEYVYDAVDADSACAQVHGTTEDDEDEPCFWIINDARTPAWCCNTHMYDGTGDFPATEGHPEECPFREEE